MTENNNIPNWDLNLLYDKNTIDLKNDLIKVKELTKTLIDKKPLLKDDISSENFHDILKILETIITLSSRISGYASLNLTENTQDTSSQALIAEIDQEMAKLANDRLFFEFWWKNLNEEKAESLINKFNEFSYWLKRIRLFKEHSLSQDQELVVNLKNVTGSEALINLYDAITNRYKFKLTNIDGKDIDNLTRDQLSIFIRSHSPEVREKAYRELYKIYSSDGSILGQIYQSLIRDWQIENVDLRHYKNPIEVRHKRNDLPGNVIESLLNVIKNKSSVFSSFFEHKAKQLGLKKLRRYDLYAPLKEDTSHYSFKEALDIVLDAFNNFSPKFASLAKNIVDSNHFSAKPSPGKQGGAFCASIEPGETPWVLMTFNGKRQDLFTIAHELGHAVHSQLAEKHNIFNFHATLPLAETASTFSEMILADYLLKGLNSELEKKDMLFHLLDDAYATILRQGYFALFEIEAHKITHECATVEEICKIYNNNLNEQFGKYVEISEEFKWEWASIPHFFHTPFYVYAYSFGQLLVYSLWKQYEVEGKAFVPKLFDLLSMGGSKPPLDILKNSGFENLNDSFWEGGFQVIESFLTKLK